MRYPRQRKTFWILQGKTAYGYDVMEVGTSAKMMRREARTLNQNGWNVRVDKYVAETPDEGGET